MVSERTNGEAVVNGGRLVYSVDEAAKMLGVSRNSAFAAAAKGDIPTIRIGRRLLVPKVQFDALLAGRG